MIILSLSLSLSLSHTHVLAVSTAVERLKRRPDASLHVSWAEREGKREKHTHTHYATSV
jgi:hypothetical protein